MAAVLSIGLTVLSSVRRRRQELALLKALGMTRGQLWRIVSWQTGLILGLAVAVGLPLGIAAGRWAWAAFAGSLGAVPVTEVPLATLALGVLLLAAVGSLLTAIPAAVAARTARRAAAHAVALAADEVRLASGVRRGSGRSAVPARRVLAGPPRRRVLDHRDHPAGHEPGRPDHRAAPGQLADLDQPPADHGLHPAARPGGPQLVRPNIAAGVHDDLDPVAFHALVIPGPGRSKRSGEAVLAPGFGATQIRVAREGRGPGG